MTMARFNQIIQGLFPGLNGNGDEDRSSEEEEEALLDHQNGGSGNNSSEENMEQDGQQQERGEVESGESSEVSSEATGCEGRDRGRGKKEKPKRKRKQQFDISLPAQHLYLGELEEEGRANLEDEETTPTLALLCISKRVLFPEETLPMHIYNPHMIQMLRDASTKQKPVAICTDLRRRETYGEMMRRPTQQELAEYGTTAEIVAFREEESEYFYGPCFVVKLHGKQRFKLLEVFRKMNGLMEGRVRILPEQHLPPRPHDLFTCPPHIYTGCHATQVVARRPDCTMEMRERLEQCRKRLQSPRLSNTLCPVPSWVFRFYETDYLREKLMMEQELKTFEKEDSETARLPEDADSLSYWLARRLPIDEPSKLQLLSIHCPTQRIQRGLQILQEFTDLCCAHCNSVITQKEHMFSMSVDGPLAAYVNPGGHVHDTLTVTSATNLRKSGSATTEHSWFPGYKWTIMNCRTCGDHKGWQFEATKKKMVPNKFYGLVRPALQLRAGGSLHPGLATSRSSAQRQRTPVS